MRRLLPRLLILLTPCLGAAAGSVTIGGGLNLSSISNPDLFTPVPPNAPAGYSSELSSRTGFNAGVGYERDALPWLSFAAELNVETRGVTSKATHPSPNTLPPDVEIRLKMLYLQLPVLATVKHSFGPLTAGAFGGPAVGRLIQAERKRFDNGVEQSVQKQEANKTDFGLEAGATVEYAVGPGAVFLRPSYYWGLIDFPEDFSAKHRVGKLRVGYKLSL